MDIFTPLIILALVALVLGAITGKDGDALSDGTQLAEVQKWSFNPTITIVEYASNLTGGVKKRIAGTKNGTGTIDGCWNETTAIVDQIDVGDEVTLTLKVNATNSVSIPAIITAMTVDTDINEGGLVPWTAEFGVNGAWTWTTG